ncbi:hypothetical protein SEVIR_3G058101v4 [Setaria viridis]
MPRRLRRPHLLRPARRHHLTGSRQPLLPPAPRVPRCPPPATPPPSALLPLLVLLPPPATPSQSLLPPARAADLGLPKRRGRVGRGGREGGGRRIWTLPPCLPH